MNLKILLHCYFGLLFIGMVVGCATPTISSPANFPLATPRPTRTASPEPSYPTVTEMNAEIDKVTSCTLPCWHSIQIGTSTYEEVENLLNQHEGFAISNTTLSSINTNYFYISEQGIEEGYATFDFRRYSSESKPIVTNINLYEIPNRTLAEWIELLGEPSYAYGVIDIPPHQAELRDWTIGIIWVDQGVEMSDSGSAPNPMLEANFSFGRKLKLSDPSILRDLVANQSAEGELIPWVGYAPFEQYYIEE